MWKLFKDTFKTTNDGIILTIPFVVFMCVISLYIAYSREVVDTSSEMILSGVTMLFMFSAFCSGWFYMVKKCVEFSKKEFILDEDKAKESFKLIQSFPTGIGKYFLNYIGVSIMFLGIVMLMAYIMYYVSIPLIQDMNFTIAQMSTVINSPQETQNFLNNLPQEQLIALFNLNLILMVIASVFSFMMLLWMPEIIFTGRNPFTALFTSIFKLFKKFGKSLGLFLYITILNFVVAFINTFSLASPVTYMIAMIIYFYFIVYVVVLIFSYYDKEFNEPAAAAAEETEDNSDSGADS